MSCEWGHDDCKFEGSEKCDLCFSDSFHYKPAVNKRPKGLARVQQKADGRMGSKFEYNNHKRNSAILSGAVSSMTLNSGATVVEKGDEQILGNIRVMEELKTKVVQQAPGKKTFTIQKKWLDKLHTEAKERGMEFWYLKFSFYEADDDVYVAVEQDTIMSMISTMVNDRTNIEKERLKTAVAEKRRDLVEAELVAARAEIEYLKAQLALSEQLEGKNDLLERSKLAV